MNDLGSMIDLSSMRQVQVKPTAAPSVWRISLPWQPWKFSAAERERQSIVEKLSSALPFQALWLSDWASDDSPGWRVLPGDGVFSTLHDEISKGAWALFFFKQDPGAIFDALVPSNPTNDVDAARVVGNLGAGAAIWSWYDDKEWLVALPGKK